MTDEGWQPAPRRRVQQDMRAILLVLSVVGCEAGVTPAATTQTPPHVEAPHVEAPQVVEPAVDDEVARQQIDVTVREYRTEKPIRGATIELLRTDFCDYSNAPPCANPMIREAKTTDNDGRMVLHAAARTGWRVERISAPGYATECPTGADPFGDLLVQEDEYFHDRDIRYVCHLIPPAAVVIRTRKAAIAAARKHVDLQDWLRTHRDARATAFEDDGVFRVDFESGTDQQVAFVSLLGGVWLPDWQPMASPGELQ
jgi:hypothetical protein